MSRISAHSNRPGRPDTKPASGCVSTDRKLAAGGRGLPRAGTACRVHTSAPPRICQSLTRVARLWDIPLPKWPHNLIRRLIRIQPCSVISVRIWHYISVWKEAEAGRFPSQVSVCVPQVIGQAGRTQPRSRHRGGNSKAENVRWCARMESSGIQARESAPPRKGLPNPTSVEVPGFTHSFSLWEEK